MKNDNKLLQMLQRISEPDDQLLDDARFSTPVIFDLEAFTATDTIDVIEVEPLVVVPIVRELTYVPAPEGLQ